MIIHFAFEWLNNVDFFFNFFQKKKPTYTFQNILFSGDADLVFVYNIR